MKRIFLLTCLILAVSLTSFARKFVADGKTYSALGNYKIELDDNYMMVNGKTHRPYVVTYENSNLEVRIAVDMEKKMKIYYVISDDLCIKYVAHRNYFGVEKLGESLENDGFKTSDAALNRLEYFRQKAITTNYSWRKDNTRLVAAFFPMLLNNVENLLASK
jgi:hypothetical protein